jgi:hypothetical protein
MTTVLGVLAGAVLFLWPALLNGYPLLFSDTGGLLAMALEPTMGWDKPWIYGPFALLLHGRTTLWLVAAGQSALLSHTLWLAAKAARPWGAGQHVVLCAILALLTAAPWFASLLMPDVFAPMVVLCVFALAWPERLTGPARGWLAAVGTLAVAVHLAHLVLAAGCIALAMLVRRAVLWRPALPLAAALTLLVLSNALGNGVLGVSPYGSVFMAARLVADGPGRALVDARCPAAGWHICGWKGRLTDDSDAFLWAPEGPVWDNDRYGPILFAPEAGRIVRGTVLAYPGEVAAAMARNTARQLARVDLGDTLGPDYLDLTVLPVLRTYFPAAEVARYRASVQVQGRLRAAAASLVWPQRAALLLGLAGTLAALVLWRRAPGIAALSLLVLGGLVANAFSTGALSGPHDRYQARIAWLLLVPPVLLTLPGGRTPRAAGAPRPRSPGAAAP